MICLDYLGCKRWTLEVLDCVVICCSFGTSGFGYDGFCLKIFFEQKRGKNAPTTASIIRARMHALSVLGCTIKYKCLFFGLEMSFFYLEMTMDMLAYSNFRKTRIEKQNVIRL